MARDVHNKHIRDLYPVRSFGRGAELLYQEYKNLLMNAVTIDGVDFNVEALIKDALIEGGVVGYDNITGKWAFVYGEGLNELGNPTNLTFVFRNGVAFARKAYYEPDPNGAYIIKALPSSMSLGAMIARTTEFLANCDVAIVQNINACKTPYIIVSKNKDLQLSVEHAIQQQQDGQPVIVVSEELGDALKSVNISVDYVADRVLTIRDAERDRLLNKLGIMSANINKRERVQVGEVNATVGQCEDYIYLMIDTFNKQMDTYGLPFEMRLNGSLEALYDDSDSSPDNTQNTPIQGENEVINND